MTKRVDKPPCQEEGVESAASQEADNAALDQIRQQTEAALQAGGTRKGISAKETRRSISVKGTTHQWIRDYARSLGRSTSSVVEELIHQKLDAADAPMPSAVERRPPQVHEGRNFELPLIL